MRRWERVVVGTVLAISLLVLVVAGGIAVLTGTDWGHERIRRLAQHELQGVIHGQVSLGRLSGNLLTGMTVHDLSIRDSAGRPFVTAAAIEGQYGLMDFFHKHIWVRTITLTRPVVVLDRPPGSSWNWERLFATSSSPQSPDTVPGWGSWIRFVDVRIIEGSFAVRAPWAPDSALRGRARDSAVNAELRGGSRVLVVRVAGGFQQVVQFDSITATVPLLRLAQPGERERLIRLSNLSAHALPFRPPAAEVLDLGGTFPFTNDSIWCAALALNLPGSRITGTGRYTFSSGDMTLRLHAAPVALADLRWLYPRLPSDGGGPLDFTLVWNGRQQEYHAQNAKIVTQGSSIAGRAGVRLDPSLTFYDTRLDFRDVDTRLIEQLIPGLTSPRRGKLSGSGSIAGTRAALALDADVSFADQKSGVSTVAGHGGIGFPGHGVVMRALHLQLEPLQVGLLSELASSLPIGGVVSGTATVDGSTTSSVRVVGDLDHLDRGATSRITGSGTISLASRHDFTLDADAHPVSLAEVGRVAPSLGLHGDATGPVHASGTFTRITGNTSLRLDDGSAVNANGTVELTGAHRYDVTATARALDLRAVLADAPATSLNASIEAQGSGFTLATMNATLAADAGPLRWDGVAIDTASIRATIAGGCADIARLFALGYHTNLTASGTFGLIRGESGSLAYRVAVDSLGAYNRWIPGAADDTTTVPPRPGLVASAFRKARADSTRIAQKTEVERIVTGRPPPTLHVTLPRSVRADTIGGSLYAAGTATGNLYDFDLHGRAGGENITARGDFVRRFQSDYAWVGARTATSKLVIGLDADTVMANGFALDTIAVRAAYQDSSGHVDLLIRQGKNRDYTLDGDFMLAARSEIRITTMRLRLDTAIWTAPHASIIRWGGPGLDVDDFELRNRTNGRVYLNGLLPTDGAANFTTAIDNLPLGDVMDLLQSDLQLAGLFTLDGSMTGTVGHPAFRGAFGLLAGKYGEAAVPTLRGRFGYADDLLTTHIDAVRTLTPSVAADSATLATLDAHLPINLAISGVTGSRLIHQPVSVALNGDSLPIDLLPQFTTVVSNVRGIAAGTIDMTGYFDHPVLAGGLTLQNGAVTLTSTSMSVDHVVGSVRMVNDTVYVDSLAGRSRGPIRVAGTIAVGNWRQPTFNLSLAANSAIILDNSYGKLQADGALTLTGPLSVMELSGLVTIAQGVIRGPESTSKHVIASDDPTLFEVIDTAVSSERKMLPAPSPLMDNLHMNVAVSIDRDTWVRTHDANIEIYTEDPITVRGTPDTPDLTGAITTDRGDYTFLSRRFAISRGSALFVGGREVNPTLQITGEYQVQVTGAPQTNIKVLIGGTMKKPKLTLESDAQPPKSQSELLSLLAFGHSTTSLLSVEGSSVTGAPTGSGVVGQGAQYAVGRLADVALGVVTDELQTKAGQALGTDYLNITPADVPTEVSQSSSVGSFFQQTQVEAGKYLNPRTFLEAQTVGGYPGLRIQYRTGKGWIYEANTEPRIVLLDPSLSEQPYRTRSSLALILLRDWRF